MTLEFDPKFCAICQDRPPEGRLLVVVEPLQKVVGDVGVLICALCGSTYTDRRAATNDETGEIGVLQFEHHLFNEEKLSGQIKRFVDHIDAMICHVCDGPAGEFGVMPSRDFAIKMLRMHPDADIITLTCDSCASLGLCNCGACSNNE